MSKVKKGYDKFFRQLKQDAGKKHDTRPIMSQAYGSKPTEPKKK